MAGAVTISDFRIIFGALIDIFDHQGNRCASRDRAVCAIIFEHAGEDFHSVRFFALRHKARCAGAALIQKDLQHILSQRQSGGAAINHAANGRPMTFAPASDPKKMSESIV